MRTGFNFEVESLPFRYINSVSGYCQGNKQTNIALSLCLVYESRFFDCSTKF